MTKASSLRPEWHPPVGWTSIRTFEMHTGGEPLRIITEGLPTIKGSTVLEKRRYFREHYDQLRTGLLFEPRGHADMYGALLSPSAQADFDVFFLHNEGYSTMCGHAIIALTKFVIETGLAAGPKVTFQAPAGRIEATGMIVDGHVVKSKFRNVPSFLYRRDQSTQVPDFGPVTFDIAYGGAFYAFVDAASHKIELNPASHSRLIEAGRAIKRAVMKEVPIQHPFEPDLSFLYGTIFTGFARDPAHHSRNVCIFAEGEVDRSATGTGVSARAALHVAKGELNLNESITIESILGSTMSVTALERVKYGPFDAVIPEVGGSAYFVGRSEFWFDPKDPLRDGFIFR